MFAIKSEWIRSKFQISFFNYKLLTSEKTYTIKSIEIFELKFEPMKELKKLINVIQKLLTFEAIKYPFK